MIERFRRRPNPRDREAIERQIAKLTRNRRDEVKASAGVVLLIAAVFAIGTPFVRKDVLPSFSLGQSFAITGAFLVILVVIQTFIGLPTEGGIRRSFLFDREELRALRRQIDEFRAALDGEVTVLRCDATDVIGIGEDEDGPDYYAYQVGPDRIFLFERLDEEPPYSSFEVVKLTADADVYFAVHRLGKPLRVRQVLPASALPKTDDDEMSGRLEDLIPAAAERT